MPGGQSGKDRTAGRHDVYRRHDGQALKPPALLAGPQFTIALLVQKSTHTDGALCGLQYCFTSFTGTKSTHTDGALVCLQYCCWALKNLSLNEANKKRIASGRAPRLIVEALRRYSVYWLYWYKSTSTLLVHKTRCVSLPRTALAALNRTELQQSCNRAATCVSLPRTAPHCRSTFAGLVVLE